MMLPFDSVDLAHSLCILFGGQLTCSLGRYILTPPPRGQYCSSYGNSCRTCSSRDHPSPLGAKRFTGKASTWSHGPGTNWPSPLAHRAGPSPLNSLQGTSPPEHSVPATWAWTIGHTLWREEGVVTLCKVTIRLSKSKCTTEYYIKYTDLSSQDLNRRGNDPIE
jgi:hypothetical protein